MAGEKLTVTIKKRLDINAEPHTTTKRRTKANLTHSRPFTRREHWPRVNNGVLRGAAMKTRARRGRVEDEQGTSSRPSPPPGNSAHALFSCRVDGGGPRGGFVLRDLKTAIEETRACPPSSIWYLRSVLAITPRRRWQEFKIRRNSNSKDSYFLFLDIFIVYCLYLLLHSLTCFYSILLLCISISYFLRITFLLLITSKYSYLLLLFLLLSITCKYSYLLLLFYNYLLLITYSCVLLFLMTFLKHYLFFLLLI